MSEPKHLSAGPHGPVDKQTIGFQGRYKDKHKIKRKREVDDFMADCYRDNGFVFSFYFRSISPPENHMRLKLSELHSRVFGVFYTLSDSNHKC